MYQQIQIQRYGDTSGLVMQRREEELVPASDEVVVRVKYSGVNFADVQMRLGYYYDAPPRPFVPGYEVSGVVESVGAGVTDLKPDAGGRAAHLRAGEMLGGDRAVWRPDAAEPRAGTAEKRGEHHRHVAAEHRGGGGPEAVCGDAAQAEHSAAAQRHRNERSRSAGGGQEIGLPGAGAAQLRAKA